MKLSLRPLDRFKGIWKKDTLQLDEDLIADLAAKTKFSVEEIKKSYRGFINDFPDGQLKLDQVKRIYAAGFPEGDSDKFAEYVFKVNHPITEILFRFHAFTH